jgi:cell division protein FtsW
VQVILNVAVVTSSMPPTGVALPFISYGGNSLWIFMGGMGITLNISRQISGGGEIVREDTEEVRRTKRKSKRNKRSVRRRRAAQS